MTMTQWPVIKWAAFRSDTLLATDLAVKHHGTVSKLVFYAQSTSALYQGDNHHGTKCGLICKINDFSSEMKTQPTSYTLWPQCIVVGIKLQETSRVSSVLWCLFLDSEAAIKGGTGGEGGVPFTLALNLFLTSSRHGHWDGGLCRCPLVQKRLSGLTDIVSPNRPRVASTHNKNKHTNKQTK